MHNSNTLNNEPVENGIDLMWRLTGEANESYVVVPGTEEPANDARRF